MGKIECTQISGHFLQFALWFKNGRFHWTLIRPREKTVSSTLSFPTWLKRADALLLWLTLDYSLPRLRRNLRLGLSGAGFAPSEVGPRQQPKSICMLQESTRQLPVSCHRTHKRSGECPLFPSKEVSSELSLQATSLCFRHFLEQATTSSKDSFKREGVSFYLSKETIVAWKQKESAPSSNDIATGTLFTVWQKPFPFLRPH